MKHDHSINKLYKYLLLAFVTGLFSLNINAQGKNHERQFNKPGRSFSPNENKAQRQPNVFANNQSNNPGKHNFPVQVERQPQANNQSNNPGKHDFPRQEPQVQPRQVERQPQANNNDRSRRVENNNSSNNDRRFGNQRNYPRASHYDNYRYRPEYRPPVYSSRNPGWRYSYLPRRNTIITSFSFPFQTIYYGGYGYRYCDGVYYRPYNNLFRVVAPPVGIYINILPFGYRRIVVHDYPYYYYNGTYYDVYEDSYRVVAPPLGAIVESIPEGYETIVINGETYYKVDDVQYKPVIQRNGEIWYEVIKAG